MNSPFFIASFIIKKRTIAHTNDSKMIDKRIKFLLNFINGKPESSKGYIVIDAEEIISASPKKLALCSETVCETVKILQSLGYVTLKYNDGNSFCLFLTENGKSALNGDSDIELKKLIIIAISAFIGSILGCLFFFTLFR